MPPAGVDDVCTQTKGLNDAAQAFISELADAEIRQRSS
jgi:hypothetical protein